MIGGICLEMFDNFMRVVKILNIIIYARLSKEEQGKSKEEQSRSIKNQIDMCKKFIEDEQKAYPKCQFKIAAILKDDGVSGTTFDRNDFNKLISKIESNQANMVITKDLSRLGRDHIKADDYIENWFPEHNVRYVSIMESVDTYADTVSNEVAPLINWSNEHFARQTSKKIKGTFLDYRKKGKWTGGEPPLGYQIDPHDKYHFIIEPKGAEIVKRIFALAKENKSLEDIANTLIKEKVPIPSVIKGNKRKLNQDIIEIWNSGSIKDILGSEMYIGNMVQGKTTRLNHKSKTIVYLPKEQWSIVENTHEPIIDKQTFDSVQLLIKSNKNKTMKTHDYLLKGMIKCAECGHSISIQHYKERKNNYTICNYYRKYGSKKEVCTSHRQTYEDLEKLVLKTIKEECLKYVDSTNFANKLKDKEQSQQIQTDIKLKIDKCNREIIKLEKQKDIIYNDRLTGDISIEDYKRRTKSINDSIEYEQNNLKRLNETLQEIINKNIVEPEYSKIVKEFLALKKPNKIVITKLINVIYLSEDGTIDIHFKVQNPYK
jgi:DNA invertase Pin-like site-specific DNA recombinase